MNVILKKNMWEQSLNETNNISKKYRIKHVKSVDNSKSNNNPNEHSSVCITMNCMYSCSSGDATGRMNDWPYTQFLFLNSKLIARILSNPLMAFSKKAVFCSVAFCYL